IRDELRRRTIASMLTARRAPETTLQWTDDRESRAADAVTCLHDDLPGSGNFPQSDAREIGVVPLLSLLPFLLADHAPPAPPAAAGRSTSSLLLGAGSSTVKVDFESSGSDDLPRSSRLPPTT